LAESGLQFDMSTPHGKLMVSILSSLAEFERDLLRERVKSGLAAGSAKGKLLGRQQRVPPKSDKLARKALNLIKAGRSYREVARQLKIDKNTVLGIVRRARTARVSS